ncbi:MAG TPA: class I SAM-dependent methyltransferase [Acidimicrobiales bacterium]|nr:class I SAM-dependent methyltransferase [Acidimicrobiales bacterium]
MIELSKRLERHRVLPLTREPRFSDRLVGRVGCGVPMKCPVCGCFSLAERFADNLRESGNCAKCGATNRQRQLALVILRCLLPGRVVGTGLVAVSAGRERIFNTEAAGPVHRALAASPNYVCSEYVGQGYRPGDDVEGTRHEDLQELSFADASIDVVISSDVLEHVPDPYQAHREIFRVLDARGVHVFTVPFLASEEFDQHRSCLTPDGNVVHLLEPQYHDDPLRKGGALVYTLFGLEMLVELAKIGFRTNVYNVRSVCHGIYGHNALVFVAQKPQSSE